MARGKVHYKTPVIEICCLIYQIIGNECVEKRFFMTSIISNKRKKERKITE